MRYAPLTLTTLAALIPREIAATVREVYKLTSARRFDYLLVGLDARDPLLRIVSAYPHVAYPSRLYLVSWPSGDRPHEQLDDRPAYVDIATL